MPCCNQSIAHPTTKTDAERCEELQPHFSYSVECDKIVVKWNGLGNPDIIKYELYKWVEGPPLVFTMNIIATATGSLNAIFECVPEGEYAIRVTASIAAKVAVISNGACNSCGSTVYHYEEICTKQWDSCNCLQPCPEPQQCVGGDCVSPVQVTVYCSKNCSNTEPDDYTVMPSGNTALPSPYYLLPTTVDGNSNGRAYTLGTDANNPLSIVCGTNNNPYLDVDIADDEPSTVTRAESTTATVAISYTGYPLPNEDPLDTIARLQAYAIENICPTHPSVLALPCGYNAVVVKNIQDCALIPIDQNDNKIIQIGGCDSFENTKQLAVDAAYDSFKDAVFKYFTTNHDGITYRQRIKSCRDIGGSNPEDTFDINSNAIPRKAPMVYPWAGSRIPLPISQINASPVRNGFRYDYTNILALHNTWSLQSLGVPGGIPSGAYPSYNINVMGEPWNFATSSFDFTKSGYTPAQLGALPNAADYNAPNGVKYNFSRNYQSVTVFFYNICFRKDLLYRVRVKWNDRNLGFCQIAAIANSATVCGFNGTQGGSGFNFAFGVNDDSSFSATPSPSGVPFSPAPGPGFEDFYIRHNSDTSIDAFCVNLLRCFYEYVNPNSANPPPLNEPPTVWSGNAPGTVNIVDNSTFFELYSVQVELIDDNASVPVLSAANHPNVSGGNWVYPSTCTFENLTSLTDPAIDWVGCNYNPPAEGEMYGGPLESHACLPGDHYGVNCI